MTHDRGIHTSPVTDAGVLHIANLTALQKLHMFGCMKISANALLRTVPQLKEMRNLNLGCIDSVGSDVMSAIARSCTKIEKLRLEDSPPTLALEGIMTTFKFLPNLRYVRLFGSRGLHRANFSSPLPQDFLCEYLRTLDLYVCNSMDSEDFIAIISQCPNLTRLVITSAENLTARAYHAIPDYCPRLDTLEMAHQRFNIFSAGIISKIARCLCDTLEDWSFGTTKKSYTVNPEFYPEILRMKRLRELEISHNPSLETIRSVLANFPTLRFGLGSVKFSSEEGMALEKEFPHASLSYYCCNVEESK